MLAPDSVDSCMESTTDESTACGAEGNTHKGYTDAGTTILSSMHLDTASIELSLLSHPYLIMTRPASELVLVSSEVPLTIYKS